MGRKAPNLLLQGNTIFAGLRTGLFKGNINLSQKIRIVEIERKDVCGPVLFSVFVIQRPDKPVSTQHNEDRRGSGQFMR